MPLTPEEITAAGKMHDFVRGYKNQLGTMRWTFYISIPAGFYSSFTQVTSGHAPLGYTFLGLTLGIILCILVTWLHLGVRYRQARVLLPTLERNHGDQLSWVEVERQEVEIEKHLAAVKELDQELANGHVTP